jgi:hypothetical protein
MIIEAMSNIDSAGEVNIDNQIEIMDEVDLDEIMGKYWC